MDDFSSFFRPSVPRHQEKQSEPTNERTKDISRKKLKCKEKEHKTKDKKNFGEHFFISLFWLLNLLFASYFFRKKDEKGEREAEK